MLRGESRSDTSIQTTDSTRLQRVKHAVPGARVVRHAFGSTSKRIETRRATTSLVQTAIHLLVRVHANVDLVRRLGKFAMLRDGMTTNRDSYVRPRLTGTALVAVVFGWLSLVLVLVSCLPLLVLTAPGMRRQLAGPTATIEIGYLAFAWIGICVLLGSIVGAVATAAAVHSKHGRKIATLSFVANSLAVLYLAIAVFH
jgi:hypothetical protein